MTKQSKLRWMAGGVVAAALALFFMSVTYAQQPAAPGRGAGARVGRGAAGTAPGLLAGPGLFGGGLGGGRGLLALRAGLGRLNLTDQQKDQVKGILQSHRDRMQAFAQQGRMTARALREAILTGADESTIRAKAADAAKVEADLAVFGAQVRKDVLGVLTPDQLAKAKQLRLDALDRAEKMIQRRKKAATSSRPDPSPSSPPTR
jgi:Spy/CpxP family protein refolding chaperone